ncbi:two-component system protein B [Ziziphus jujuba]|uniref:Two-component system protein B n=1 Tax=Ziziphus jujuba TaxID=326968 RepID=A0ABM4AIG4_ZIZJJ|nr:two-component system protein B [Ziziphus jujuba]
METVSGSGCATTKKNENVIRALVVDDSPVERMVNGSILNKLLKTERYQEAVDGNEAVNLHKTPAGQGIKHKLFDLILMDSHMPNMNDIQYIINLLGNKNLREMGISSIIIGVSREENTAQRFKEAGANSYVQKPLSAGKLKPILEEFKLIY